MSGRRSARLLASFALWAATAARADEARPDAVPYRPTVSTPAQLGAPGWLEAELGGLRAPDAHPGADPRRRSSLVYALKLAWSEDWGVRLAGEGWVRQVDGDGVGRTGVGDTGIILKRRFALDDDSALGLEVSGGFPTARGAIGSGSGQPDYSLNGIYSSDFARDWHTDLNLVATRRGAHDTGTGRWQSLAAWSVSRTLADRWTAEAEVSATRQRHVPGTSQGLVALACAVRHDVVLDVGIAHSMNRATPNWQVFAGATVVVARLF